MRGTRDTIVAGDFLLYEESKGRGLGSEPDGDSVGFRPCRPEILRGLGDPPRNAGINSAGRVQLRREGLDALELHYVGAHHKRRPQCVRARDARLKLIGFGKVTFRPAAPGGVPVRVASCRPDRLPGFILTRQVDPNGRPVAFVFSGQAPTPIDAQLGVMPRAIADSVNARLLEAGQAYPAYYESLPEDLRRALNRRVQRARAARAGIWAVDKTTSGMRVTGLDSLACAAIWPKLYRRLAEYFLGGGAGVQGFPGWLGDRRCPSRNDRLLVGTGRGVGDKKRLADVVEVRGTSVRMTVDVGDVVVVPR